MPRTEFAALPDEARVWVFGSDRPITGEHVHHLLGAVDEFLASWAAHGAPLSCAREWRDDRFLVIGVDERDAGASGCSVDGLFRLLGAREGEIGASLRGSGRVFYRDANGVVASSTRAEFRKLAADGVVDENTIVFDPSITRMADYRGAFETRAKDSWHSQLTKR